MSSDMKVLAFDIGIRNLAWCLLSKSAAAPNTWTIGGWENYDLLAGTTTQDAKDSAKVFCGTCAKRASYQSAGKPTCAVHCPVSHPPLRDLSGALLKKLPPTKGLLSLCSTPPRKKTKAGILEALGGKFSLPLVAPKVTRAMSEDVASLHDSIRKFVETHRAEFQTATHILLENQPAYKNPTMKTVQILLFATLRDLLIPAKPWVGFVHASKKVQGKEAGDKGYLARKKGSEDRVAEFFEKQTVAEKEKWLGTLRTNQKKSDLCDALCMCLNQFA